MTNRLFLYNLCYFGFLILKTNRLCFNLLKWLIIKPQYYQSLTTYPSYPVINVGKDKLTKGNSGGCVFSGLSPFSRGQVYNPLCPPLLRGIWGLFPFLRGILYAIHRITRLNKMKILYDQVVSESLWSPRSSFFSSQSSARQDRQMVTKFLTFQENAFRFL